MFTNKDAVYALNSYIWKLLEANLGWTKTTYEGAVPIIPVAQQPELMKKGAPFLVYGSSIHPPGFLYALRKEAVSYVIYAGQSSEANTIVNLLVKTFERQDEAAADVNEWLATENAGRNITFGSIGLTMSQKAIPSDQEGGYVGATVLLELVYTENNDNIVTTGFSV